MCVCVTNAINAGTLRSKKANKNKKISSYCSFFDYIVVMEIKHGPQNVFPFPAKGGGLGDLQT